VSLGELQNGGETAQHHVVHPHQIAVRWRLLDLHDVDRLLSILHAPARQLAADRRFADAEVIRVVRQPLELLERTAKKHALDGIVYTPVGESLLGVERTDNYRTGHLCTLCGPNKNEPIEVQCFSA
jgi:hypothetical protein